LPFFSELAPLKSITWVEVIKKPKKEKLLKALSVSQDQPVKKRLQATRRQLRKKHKNIEQGTDEQGIMN
jgi:hypothetical protein